MVCNDNCETDVIKTSQGGSGHGVATFPPRRFSLGVHPRRAVVHNKAVYTSAPVADGWTGAVTSWAGAEMIWAGAKTTIGY